MCVCVCVCVCVRACLCLVRACLGNSRANFILFCFTCCCGEYFIFIHILMIAMQILCKAIRASMKQGAVETLIIILIINSFLHRLHSALFVHMSQLLTRVGRKRDHNSKSKITSSNLQQSKRSFLIFLSFFLFLLLLLLWGLTMTE